jgi:hypothetical protein
MRWLGLAVVVFALLAAAVIRYVRTRPTSIAVARTLTIQAPPERVFALIEDLHCGRGGRRKTAAMRP